VADILFGDYKPTGKLPRAWLSESAAAPDQSKSSTPDIFPFGFGLTYEPVPRRESGPANTSSAATAKN
jgi:beta-glucosidase